MKRFTVFGLCFAAAFAFSVMVAVSAQAKKVEHGNLVVESHNAESHLGTSKLTIHSTDAEGSGTFTTPTTGTAVATFHNVEIEGTGKKCHSEGAPAGTVTTYLLAEETGWISKAKEETGV